MTVLATDAPAAVSVTADAWVATGLGDPTEVLQRQSVEVPAPGPGEVRVKVAAFCVNLNDTDVVRGRYAILPLAPPFTPGMESIGVVESAGQGAEHLVGQRIMGIPVLAHGGFAQYALVDAATTQVLPSWLSDADAAAVHYPYHLGWFALVDRARIQPGETLLVHAAAGGNGSAAVQLGKALGATVIATAGGPEKVEFARSLGADVVIDYLDGGFADAVNAATFGHGVDVAYDTVGGTVTTETFRCMGIHGRHLLVGYSQDIANDGAPVVTAPAVYGNFSLYGVCLVYVNDPLGLRQTLGFNWPARSEGQHAHAKLLTMLRSGAIRTVVTEEISFDDLPAAMERQENRQTMGRVVVHVPQ